MQHMTKALVPIMEKAILHPPMVHRCVPHVALAQHGSA
jgi:hypothetical protein